MLQRWALTKQREQSISLNDVTQEKDEAVEKYFARLQMTWTDMGYFPGENIRILGNAFVEGLKKPIREGLVKARPEQRGKDPKDLLQVAKGVEQELIQTCRTKTQNVHERPLKRNHRFITRRWSKCQDAGRFYTGYAVITQHEVIKAEPLPPHLSAQEAELKALTEACRAAKETGGSTGKRVETQGAQLTEEGCPEAYSVQKATVKITAQKLMNEVVCRYGVPEVIESDRGTHFTGQIMREILKSLGIEQGLHTPYHPHSSGKVERLNGTLKLKIQKAKEETGKPWTECLLLALFSIRYTPSIITDPESMSGTHDLKPGDWVVLKRHVRKSLDSRFDGPFLVLLTTATLVKLEGKSTWIHASHCSNRFRRERDLKAAPLMAKTHDSGVPVLGYETQKAPNVFPLTPCKSVTSENIMIGCLATGYVPGPVKIQLTSGSIRSASKEMTVQYGNIFASGSFLAIPRSSLKKENQSCTVEHELTKFKTEIKIKVKDQETRDEATNAALYLFRPHRREIDEVDSYSQVNLICMIKTYSKGNINVLWKESDTIMKQGMITEYTAKDPEKTPIKISMLTIRKENWKKNKYSCSLPGGNEVKVEAQEQCNESPMQVSTYDDEEDGDDQVDVDDDSIWTTAVTFIILFLFSMFYNAAATFVKIGVCFQIIIPAVYPVIAVGYTGSTSTSIACLVNRYWPPPVSVTWDTTEGEKLSEVKDIKFPLSGDLPAYNLLSQVTINKNDWDSKTYQCNVSFYSTNIVKIIPKVCDPLPEAPSVHLLQGTCPESNGEIELTCQVYNLTSQDATLKWYINDQERRFAEDKLELGKSKNHYFALHSTVTISQSEWNNGVPVKCQVTDTNTKTTAEDTIKKCSDSFNCLAIDVFVVKPSIEDLYVHKTARITCVASNLKDTNENYSFEWSFPGGSNLNIQTEDSQLHNNGTYSVSSVLTVSPDVWLQETEFTCVFRHNGLQKPIISRLKKEKVTKTSQPVVSMFPPSAEELAQKETYTLLCLSSKFNPQNIFMGWTENDLEVSKDLYVNSESMLETGGKTYFMTSKLTIPASSWDSGFSYGCVVGHETMPNNFYRTSFDKNSDVCEHIGVNITADEEEEDIENPWEISTTFMSLFVLSLVYSVTVTLFKKQSHSCQ
ncbi:uncharacterized protein [Phyllobates terribilis]|uniref:uncharacterized protein n=1 Tax=Phyllobates terribilis TaxID=111132 RepID=UPI003CCB4811